MFNTKSDFQVASACRQKCLHAGRGRENSSDFAKMNSSAYGLYVRVYFHKKCTGKPYIEDRLACCFL